MPLPASGAISLFDVNVELGLTGTTTITMNDAIVRTLFGQASGAVDLNTGHGKANTFTFNKTIAANTTNYNLYNDMVAAGWNGTLKVNATVTINSSVYVYSTSTGTYGFNVSSIPSGSVISITNNGFIYGCGGAGGNATQSGGSNGGNGGPAFFTNYALSFTNNGTIYGGGGGGGAGGMGIEITLSNRSAGGGGGGGGAPNGTGGTGASGYRTTGTAGGTASLTGGGAGGLAGASYSGSFYRTDPWGNGGAGGAPGSSGGGGYQGYDGGDVDAISGVFGHPGGGPGSAGVAVQGSSLITWLATGTRGSLAG